MANNRFYIVDKKTKETLASFASLSVAQRYAEILCEKDSVEIWSFYKPMKRSERRSETVDTSDDL